MKALSLFKMPVILVGLAMTLVLSPACKAQFEIAPDHFDGTDSWDTKAHKVGPVRSHQMPAAGHANHNMPGFGAIPGPTTTSLASKPAHQIQSVILPRREARTQKVEQQENRRRQRN